MHSAKAYVLMRVWQENGQIKYEDYASMVFCEPELILELPPRMRPLQDWFEEVFNEIDLAEYMLPDNLEVCEEPILYEAIGILFIRGHTDYWGEYDEEYEFELEAWSCEAEEDPILLKKGNSLILCEEEE